MSVDYFDSLKPIIDTLFGAEIFPYFLGGLVGLSVLAVLIYIIQSRKQGRSIEDEKSRLAKSWQSQLNDCQNVNAELSKSVESLKAQLLEQANQMQTFKAELNNKDELLRKEILAKEQIWSGLKNTENELTTLKNKLQASEKELGQAAKLKEELSNRDDQLKKQILDRERMEIELKNTEVQLAKIQTEQESLREVHSGLKEQYADLERQVDALNQALALEKTLHERLKEEHNKCTKSALP
mgnify:CR=1 FL=1